MVIQIIVNTINWSMSKDFHWTFMDTMKAVESAKVVNTIPKALTVINASHDIIDHMINTGMKLMCAIVC